MTHARLTPEIKEKAEDILKKLGISISAAYEMFLSTDYCSSGDSI